jgi:class 3 adenylate cyclase
MSAERKPDLHLEIAHVLFVDVVGYSKLLADEQSETLQLLNQIVRGTAEFRTAEEKGELIRLPTGDGIALVFLTKPEAPVQCALQISKAIKSYPELGLRMGIHSGSVNQMRDVNDRSNVTGAGINIAQRVMDCGDAGHILLSRRVAEDLEQYRLWQPYLHDLGECEVKHGVRVHVFNLYTDEVGNRDVPTKLKPIAQEPAAAAVVTSASGSARSKHALIAAAVLLVIALALGSVFWVVSHRAAPKSTSTSPKGSRSSPAEIGKPLDLPALAQKARPAVVLIVGYDAAGKIIKTGSGFFVSADGRLVTNCHVIEGIVNAQAKLESGAIYNIDGVLACSSALDLAVLKADARDMQFLLVDGASNPPQPGTRIAVIGSPLALEGSLSEGIVSANRSGEDGSWLQISASISPGSSGSPVLDRHGRVVGVTTLIAKEGQNLNFARSSHDLWNFLQTIDPDTKPKAFSENKDEILSDPDFIAARKANERGDGAAALKLLNTLQQRYPNEPRLLFQFAYAYETLGLHDEAYRSWRAYIDIDPSDPAAWRHFAIVAANLNRISDAINAYKQTLKIKPDADTWRLLGDLYDAQGQHALMLMTKQRDWTAGQVLLNPPHQKLERLNLFYQHHRSSSSGYTLRSMAYRPCFRQMSFRTRKS